MQSSEFIHRQTSITVQAYVLLSLSSSRYTRSGLGASFNADGDGDGDEDNDDQDNDDQDNNDLVLLLPLSISGLLLFGFAISHRAEFRRLGLCVTVSLRHGNGNMVWVGFARNHTNQSLNLFSIVL
ncbi:hypothetical protein LWI29_019250 [Acer saccharum]|uniref:Uncharacterized protein n=1 Tax=Acer saccharum TaxID=4024 RepID=A0AA39RY17_ACESA|nr:hypothetical protein LWI29_019250 [Acer saccharum]